MNSFDNVPSATLPMSGQDPLIRSLVQAGLLPELMAEQVVARAREAGLSCVAWLVQQQQVAADAMARHLAAYLAMDFYDLGQTHADTLVKDLIDDAFIRQHRVLPLFIKDQSLHLAISEPAHLEAVREIKFHTDLSVHPVVVAWDKLSHLVDTHLSQRQYQLMSQFQSGLENDDRIVVWVTQILQDAIQKGASDIHFEPYKTSYRIRFRIDGILHKMTQLPQELASRIIARLKVISKLDISERRLPQDGRFSCEINSQMTKDCRISTCPTLFGEKIVLRILDAEKISLNVDDLGFELSQKQQFLHAIHKPQGMVLVTGPTGSGKTVSLYVALNALNSLDKNICSVEEPVEITLPGINQVNINLKTDLTFAKVLRTFLRQDPDILMVGEIRDYETAETAIKAAQTGHLVLSTLHTNSAVETLTRLLMMGVSAFNVAHSIHLIVAQRLLRKLCIHCRQPQLRCDELCLNLGFSETELDRLSLYEAVGCDKCMKGYSGRTGIFEVLPMSTNIATLIHNNATVAEITQAAQQAGMMNLRAAALCKARAGITSIAEIQRVLA